MRRAIRTAGKAVMSAIYRNSFRAGMVVVPNHYYTPIADVHELEKSRRYWAHRAPMTGIDIAIEPQVERLTKMVKPFEPEYRGNEAFKTGAEQGFGPGFGYIEAQCLHGVLRALKPKRILEVGSGVSTYCAQKAVALNAAEGSPAEITCIEPYPSAYLRGAKDLKLIRSKVQELPPDTFDMLEAGDFLFIDSTHAIRPGGDVLYLYLEVLPRLKPGVVIHIHDIYFPFAYQRNLLNTMFQWTETALLMALLTNNARLSILFSLSLLHYEAPKELAEVFPEYVPQPADAGLHAEIGVSQHFPSSTYLLTK